MDSAKVNDWMQVVGIFAVVASLLFVGLQMKQTHEIALAEALANVSAIGIEERGLIAAHADTWQKACLGEQLTAQERVIAANIFFNYLQNSFNTWIRIRETGIGGAGAQLFIDSSAANIHRYSGFKQIFSSYRGWSELGARSAGEQLATEYLAAVLQRVSELEGLEPNPVADVMWCGSR
jgi:hypothetical protein